MPKNIPEKIYLDNCYFNRPYDDHSEPRVYFEAQAKMAIQDQIREGKFRLVSSTVLDFEIQKSPYRERKLAIRQFLKENASEYINVADAKQIEEEADEIMSTGVKPQDAFHIACAIYTGCDYFLSTDKRLLKYQTPKLKILNPLDFIKEKENKND